jgi:hypothetical protein
MQIRLSKFLLVKNLMRYTRGRTMKTLLLFLIIVLSIGSIENALAEDVTKVGTSAANFMKIEVGARASAMGGAFVSISNDLTSMYWNPAGVAYIHNIIAHFEHLALYADIKHDFAAIAFPLTPELSIGLSTIYLTSGDIEITTENEWDGTGQYYDVIDMSLGLTVARRLTDRLNAGVTVKYLRESIWRNSANSVAADFGLIISTGIYGFDMGMSLTNIGSPMQMRGIDMQFNAQSSHSGLLESDAQLLGEKWPLPTTFKVGLSNMLMGKNSHFLTSNISSLLFSVDLLNALDSDLKANLGLEYVYAQQFSLRAGYRINYDEVSYSVGGGLKIRSGGATIVSVDYSYTDFGVLERIHRFGISISP